MGSGKHFLANTDILLRTDRNTPHRHTHRHTDIHTHTQSQSHTQRRRHTHRQRDTNAGLCAEKLLAPGHRQPDCVERASLVWRGRQGLPFGLSGFACGKAHVLLCFEAAFVYGFKGKPAWLWTLRVSPIAKIVHGILEEA